MDTMPQTLTEAIRYYADDDVCQRFLMNMRWPDGVVVCPNCGQSNPPYDANRRVWRCKANHSKRQFSIKIGTIFEDSPITLDKWFIAMWMLANDKNGVSSYELSRAIGITQKSAWFMLHRIRLALQGGFDDKFSGQVEVDETFIGGKARFMHADKRAEKITGTGGTGKAAVMGLLERHGPDGHSRGKAKPVKNTRRATLVPEVQQNVEAGAEVFTDALRSYDSLDAEYIHQVIDHAEAYANVTVHTNGIESVWAVLKRGLHGVYHHASPKHLNRYVQEFTFRLNEGNVKHSTMERLNAFAARTIGKRITYKELTRDKTQDPT